MLNVYLKRLLKNYNHRHCFVYHYTVPCACTRSLGGAHNISLFSSGINNGELSISISSIGMESKLVTASEWRRVLHPEHYLF